MEDDRSDKDWLEAAIGTELALILGRRGESQVCGLMPGPGVDVGASDICLDKERAAFG